jgi:hypothetical protein
MRPRPRRHPVPSRLHPWPPQEALLLETEGQLQRWRGKCERLRNAHAAALTDGI